MLSSRNSGKYLSAEYAREREQCTRDKDLYTAEQQAFYEITGSMGHGENREENFQVDTVPSDPLSIPKKIDVRNKPEYGGT